MEQPLINFRLGPDQYERLKEVSKYTMIPYAALIRKALKIFLDSNYPQEVKVAA